jgi:hypothetical protein
MSRLPISIVTGLIVLVLFPVGAHAEPGTLANLPAITGQGSGLVKVAPTAHDLVGPDTFDVQGTINVHDAAPNTSFSVLRRVDLNPDGNCTGAAWLTLPPPNMPNLMTSAGGAGALHFEISRGAPFVDGVRFDVQWRLAGNDGSVLQSDCVTVAVN